MDVSEFKRSDWTSSGFGHILKEGIDLLASMLQPRGIDFKLELKLMLIMHLTQKQEGLAPNLFFSR